MEAGEARDVTLELGLEIEEAHLTNQPLYGCNIDTIKCYDTQVRPVVFGAARDLGACPGFVGAQERLYGGLQRAFAYGKAVGPWWHATTSFLQGCALSCILAQCKHHHVGTSCVQ